MKPEFPKNAGESRNWRLHAWFEQKLELDRAGSSSNLRPMEGLRGLAVFLVFLVHFVSLTEPWWKEKVRLAQIATNVHAMGNVGVDLFFVLSGFLIYGALISKVQPFWGFVARRIRRIYPTFLVVFFVYLMLSWLVPSKSKLPQEADATLVYILQNLLLMPGLWPIEPLIAVAWSLSYEVFYYLLMPVLIGVFGLRDCGRRTRVLFFIVLGAGASIAFSLLGGPVRMLMFVSGILLFEARAAGLGRTLGSGLGLISLVLALMLAMQPAPGPEAQVAWTLLLGFLFFVLCLSVFYSREVFLARALSWTPLRWLGNMSYSYYLIHGLALNAAVLILPYALPVAAVGPMLFLLLVPLLFAVTLIPSFLLFVLIERPLSLTASPVKSVATPINH